MITLIYYTSLLLFSLNLISSYDCGQLGYDYESAQSSRSVAVDEMQKVHKEDVNPVDEAALRTVNGSRQRRSTDAELYVPMIPDSCKKMKICENVPNYPRELADEHIKRLGDKRSTRSTFSIDDEDTKLTRRHGPLDKNIQLCKSIEKKLVPEAAKAQNKEWYFVLNDRNSPLQGCYVDICESKGDSCAKNIMYFYWGYVATCRQKYVQQKMLVIDRKGNVTEENIEVQSCCSCVASYVGHT